MAFTSLEFVVFFLAVLLVCSRVRNFFVQKSFLLLASFCFYLSWNIPCILVILFTAAVDYHIGRKLGRTEDPAGRKRLLVLSLVTNLSVLGFFKYSSFVVENIFNALNGLGFHPSRIRCDFILPPGISYFTFASMSYVIDVYFERLTPCEKRQDYTLFITFFPKVLAGPIVRAAKFLPQLQERARVSMEDLETGLCYFLVGAVKKLVISDQIAGHVDLIFSAPSQYDGFTLLQGLLGYTVQIYCDFSGYSDMAIGCARMLGFRFPENFQMPYSATSISEFWRRWHITLSEWFRDYLFIPLEVATRANRNPTLRASVNLFITMLLCGLWHGAGWNFVIWGGIHGAALATHKVWTNLNPKGFLPRRPVYQLPWTLFSRFLTLGVVVLGWAFFRTPTFMDASSYLSRMLAWKHDGMRLFSPYILPAIAAVVLTHLLINKDRIWASELPRRSVGMRVLGYSCLLGLIVFLGATDSVPFIYFQF